MNPRRSKLRPPVKRHGGKAYLARRIVGCFPKRQVYVEPFVGGGSVLLNKPKAEKEVAGDLDAGLMGLWANIKGYRDRPPCPFDGDAWATFEWMVDRIEYAEATFDLACEGYFARASPRFGPALDYLIRNRFSRGGLGKTFAWSDRLRGGQPGDVNAWETAKEELPALAERVKDVEFHCRPALELVREFDSPGTLFYLDPPYLHSTRTARAAYRHEMDEAGHIKLLEALAAPRGTFFLSGYRSGLYDDIAGQLGWHRIEWDIANHSGQGKSKHRRTECLWSNRPFPGSSPCRAAVPQEAVA